MAHAEQTRGPADGSNAVRWTALLALALAGFVPMACTRGTISGLALDGGDAGISRDAGGGMDSGPDAGRDAGPDAGGCYPGTVWVGDVCVALSCADYPFMASCYRDDGSLGECVAGVCTGYSEGTDDCGSLGITCPPPSTCVGGFCEQDGGFALIGSPCDQPCADPTQLCVVGVGCVKSVCRDDDDSQACATDGGFPFTGFCCHGACLTESDGQDCGACERGCGPEGACELGMYGGYCVLARASCMGPATLGTANCILPGGGAGNCCGDACVDFDSDSDNCQGCGLGCPDESLCTHDGCGGCSAPSECPPGKDCSPIGCLAPCTAATEGWFCFLDAGFSGTCCGSRCIDIDGDPLNCGGCGVVCDAGQYCDNACTSYADCAKAPTGSDAPCVTDSGGFGECCGVACIDPYSDPRNCGACEVQCPEGASCMGNGCFVNGRVVYCGSDAGCPAGSGCVDGDIDCLPTTCDGFATYCALDGGAAGTCCGSSCEVNALGCNVSCPVGSVAAPRQFEPYPLCGRLDGGPACIPGAVCPAGTQCDPFDQACEYLSDCSPEHQLVGNASCVFGAAVTTARFHPLTTSGSCCGGQCVDLSQDATNCGSCGNACASGMCSPFGCVPVGPTSDCLMTCAPGSYCQNGQCAISCNGLPFCLADDGTVGFCCAIEAFALDFTCAHFLDDPQNCGSCGNACPAGQTCRNGACSGAAQCPIGRQGAFCNLDAGPSFVCCPSGGCTDTDRDPLNCGNCGQACSSGLSCVDGECG